MYATLRTSRPVCRIRLPTGALAWLVTTWEDARVVLSDPRFSKAAMTAPDAPKARPGALPPGVLFTTDPPEHTALRALLSRGLTGQRVAALRPRMIACADALISALVAPADLVSGFAEPFAMRVICDLLGVPSDDQARFAAWSATVLAVDSTSALEVEVAQRELLGYIAGLVAAKCRAPGDDVVSDLLRASTPDDHQRVVGLVATLLVTGYETMVAAVANAVLTLLAVNGSIVVELTPTLLEELFRFSGFGDALRSRRAVADVVLGDVVVRAGDLVMVSTASANRDAAVFVDADSFVPGRCPNPHVGFGRGVHYCAGAGLSRTQLHVALSRLAVLVPGLRLAAPLEEIRLRGGASESPPERLLVAW
ncbi:cytochrome P450 [Lentzea tibetensis]|uniref:Cytochrome P450 n=1 Tax=Lentzea tibetensis TaxID=2591470 RepID=A0A563EFI8_9PSEU|nr:cytochrome P450 [Lentzea tibetensis]